MWKRYPVPPYAHDCTPWRLTGARRYRATDRMTVLLQVEEARTVRQAAERRWRDAHPDDLLRTIKPE